MFQAQAGSSAERISRSHLAAPGGTLTSFAAIRSPEARALQNSNDAHAQPGQASDELLISRICGGDKDALGLLFRRYAGIVRGVGYRVLRDRTEADDLLQEIFLLIHRLCGTFDSSKGSARFWILQMTYRRALCRRRYLTTRHFYKRLDLDEVADELIDPRNKAGFDNTLDGMFGAGKGQQAFAALSESQRKTLRLYFIEGYTFKEIAQKLGQSRGNVQHHYFRGLDKLRKELLGGKLGCERAL